MVDGTKRVFNISEPTGRVPSTEFVGVVIFSLLSISVHPVAKKTPSQKPRGTGNTQRSAAHKHSEFIDSSFISLPPGLRLGGSLNLVVVESDPPTRPSPMC